MSKDTINALKKSCYGSVIDDIAENYYKNPSDLREVRNRVEELVRSKELKDEVIKIIANNQKLNLNKMKVDEKEKKPTSSKKMSK